MFIEFIEQFIENYISFSLIFLYYGHFPDCVLYLYIQTHFMRCILITYKLYSSLSFKPF